MIFVYDLGLVDRGELLSDCVIAIDRAPEPQHENL